ncbi:MAG TPA: DUF222 domain-containing protein, partial [Nocardioidaceae bacterium]|nr:DUF222 domain-containing protein [Nocardioidaceae bacterium]
MFESRGNDGEETVTTTAAGASPERNPHGPVGSPATRGAGRSGDSSTAPPLDLTDLVHNRTEPRGTVLDVAAIERFLADLADLDREVSDAERIDQIGALERVKAACAAAQARVTVDLEESVVAERRAKGLPERRCGHGVAGQVALARRESPHAGRQHLGLAKALVREMPHTLAGLGNGDVDEWGATVLVRETAHLSRADRAQVDRVLAGDPAQLHGLGPRALAARARDLAYRLDPDGVVRRTRKAHSERRVTCRPAPDTMGQLSALLPVTQAVAAYAALSRHADQQRTHGDTRSRGQIMADTLVERVTGQATAAGVPVEINLVITDRTLLTGGTDPAHLPGYGTLPGQAARDQILATLAAMA